MILIPVKGVQGCREKQQWLQAQSEIRPWLDRGCLASSQAYLTWLCILQVASDIAKDVAYASTSREVLSAGLCEESCWHFQKRKCFPIMHVQIFLAILQGKTVLAEPSLIRTL